MFHWLGLIHRNHKGFTVLELLIAFAITAVVVGAATTTILQVFNGSAHSSNHMTAVRQVQTAGYWVSHDAQISQTIELADEASDNPDGTRFPLTMSWIDWDSVTYEVRYNLVGSKLQRNHYTENVLDETSTIAQYIDSDPTKTNCKLTAGAFNLPDSGDVCTITDDTGGDYGFIVINAGSIIVTFDGTTATYDAGTGAWTTPNAGDKVVITAASADTSGYWTYTTGTATNAITTDSNGDATLAGGGMLVLTITSTVGSGSQAKSETRVYEVFSRPSTQY